MIDQARINKAREAARKRIQNAKVTVDVSVYGQVPEHIQLATWKHLKQHPELMAKVKSKQHPDDWKAYTEAMGALEEKEKYNG